MRNFQLEFILKGIATPATTAYSSYQLPYLRLDINRHPLVYRYYESLYSGFKTRAERAKNAK